jgi:hypothetical protein
MKQYMKGAAGFFVALFLLIITLASYNPIVDLIRTPSLGEVLSVESESIPQNIEKAPRPYKKNGIELNLSLQFKSLNGSPNQNLFQTDYLNTGIRAELSGGTLAIIINNEENTERPHILIFPTTISIGKWYGISIHAVGNGQIHASLVQRQDEDNLLSHSLSIDRALFSTDNLIIGRGFDSARKFEGDIRNVKISAKKIAPKSLANSIYILIAGALLFLTFKLNKFNLKKYLSNICTIDFSLRPLINHKFILNFLQYLSISLLIFSFINLALRNYFANKSISVTSNLLPAYQPIQEIPLYKAELIIFLVAELIFIGWYFLINTKISNLEKYGLEKKLRFTPYLSFVYLTIAYFFSSHSIDKAIFIISLIVAMLFLLVNMKFSKLILKFFSFSLKVKVLLLDRAINIRPTFKIVSIVFLAAISIKLFVPFISSWYPVVLPNDYYESITTWKSNQSDNIIDSSKVQRCIAEKAISFSTFSETKFCEDFKTSDLYESWKLLNAWQGENGRIFYHHSYVFLPAAHYLKHSTFSTIPFVYGLGNTISTAYLMKLNPSPSSISSYFNTIPLTAIIGIIFISLLCLYISNNFLVGFLALLVSLGCYYSISYTPILLAASFNPARFIGIIFQIFSIFLLSRKENRFLVFFLIFSAFFSLFWNFEFGVIGFFGQLSFLILRKSTKNFYNKLFSLSLLFLTLGLSFKFFKPPNIDITESINFGLYNIGVPIMPMDTIIITLLIIFFVQFFLIFTNRKQNPTHRFAYFSVGIILALLSVKYFFNPSPPHLFLILLFIIPLFIAMLPWSSINSRVVSAIHILVLCIMITSAIIFTHNAGKKYANESSLFHSQFTTNFVSHEWKSFNEKIRTVTPEKPIKDRVTAINKMLEAEASSVKLLILSPYDHIISFYVNPKAYCGHFELLTNVLTINDIETIKKCVEKTPRINVIYDHALTTKCPLEFDESINPGCARKVLVKNNLVKLMDEIKPFLNEGQTIGDITIYNKK